jgi:hypothetical protein
MHPFLPSARGAPHAPDDLVALSECQRIDLTVLKDIR